jgi:histidyl-tRNA synthetase
MDLQGKGISKNLDYANSQEIPFVVFIGQKELEKDIVKLKDMKTGEEKEMNIREIIEFLRIKD